MTNLDIIKYLALNNPTRLAELLDDIYCRAWNCGSSVQYYLCIGEASRAEKIIDSELEFSESGWLNQEAEEYFFYGHELEEWSKAINSTPTITACYDGLSVTFPVKDPDYMWNNNNEYDYKEHNHET